MDQRSILHARLACLLLGLAAGCDDVAAFPDLGADASLPLDAATLARDARATDPDGAGHDTGWPDLHGWMRRSDALDIGVALATLAPDGLLADPATPNHLFLRATPTSTTGIFGVDWQAGALGTVLHGSELTSMPGPLLWEWSAMDGAGTTYGVVCCFDDALFSPSNKRRLVQLRRTGAAVWSAFSSLPNGTVNTGNDTWPPKKFAISPGTTPRVLFGNETGTFWDVTGHADDASSYVPYSVDTSSTPASLGIVSLVAPDLLLSATASGVRRCHLGAGKIACDAPATPWAQGEYVTALDAGAGRLLVTSKDSTTFSAHGYLSLDAGLTFTPISFPTAQVTRRSLSPIDGRIAVQSIEGTVYTSSDGLDWQTVLPPEGEVTSPQGMTFDAGGTLYLLYGSSLFSRTP